VSTTTRQSTPGPREGTEQGKPLTAGRLLARQEQDRERGTAFVERVARLAREQRSLSEGLQEELADLQQAGGQLEALNAPEGGMLDALVRRFRRRQAILARRSAAEGLLAKFEVVSTRLQRASAFSDELHLCALELQAEVDRLHRTVALDGRGARRSALEILSLETQVGLLEERRGKSGESAVARELDEARFNLRSTALSLSLFETAVKLGRQQLDPARELRDNVLGLHEEMAGFVLAASSATNMAGHRIQALGVAADAPLVVTELKESLAELGHAMESAEIYVEQARRLMDHVLPDLSARLQAQTETHALVSRLAIEAPPELSRQEVRTMAEQALRDEALAEVESWLND
jgi:hypothetical protein